MPNLLSSVDGDHESDDDQDDDHDQDDDDHDNNNDHTHNGSNNNSDDNNRNDDRDDDNQPIRLLLSRENKTARAKNCADENAQCTKRPKAIFKKNSRLMRACPRGKSRGEMWPAVRNRSKDEFRLLVT